MAGSWAIGSNQQPCMPTDQNGGLLKTNVNALIGSEGRYHRPHTLHSLSVLGVHCPVLHALNGMVGGGFVGVLGSVNKTRATSRAVW